VAVAARLPPEHAAQLFTEQMAKFKDSKTLKLLAEVLAAVAAKLPPEQACKYCTQAAKLLTDQIGKEKKATDLGHLAGELGKQKKATDLGYLAGGLAAVAGQLPHDQGAPYCTQALELLTDQIGKNEHELALLLLLNELDVLVAQLPPDPAAKLLTDQLGKTKNRTALTCLAALLSLVATKLPPDQAAQLLTDQMGQTKDVYLLAILTAGLKAAAARLSPDQAAPYCNQAAQLLTDQLGKHTSLAELCSLALGLRAAAAKLSPDQAAPYCNQAFKLLTDQLGKHTSREELCLLAQGLGAVADKLPPGQATKPCTLAAQLLTDQTGTSNTPKTALTLAGGLFAVAAALPPDQAAQHYTLAAKLLSRQMGKIGIGQVDTASPTYFYIYLDVIFLAEGVREVTAKLPPDQAVKYCTQAAKMLIDEMPGTENHSHESKGYIKGIFEKMAEVVNMGQTKAPFKTLTEELKAVVGKLDKRGLVNLLKYPLCVGLAQQVVLEELGQRTGRSFATLWDFVAWAEKNDPGLDLRTPWQPPRGLDE
jgi:hypothetical protein